MTDSNVQDQGADSSASGSRGLSRRTVLRGAAYTVPALTVVAMTSGSAEAASVSPNTVTKPEAKGDLAFTGSGPVVGIAAVGVAAIAAGAVAQRAAKNDPEPEA